MEVAPQVFDLLVHLIRHRDRVVSKEDLLASVWQGRIVSDFALFNRVNAARSAIGDTASGSVRSRRCRARGCGSSPRFARRKRPRRARASFGQALLLALPDRPSIAVLPFANMSRDPEQEHFADGISEDLITGLARIRWLFVIARNSAFTYKGQVVDVKQVSRELGVRYVLEGSVRRAGKRLRVSAQLVDALTGAHHWAERYDRQARRHLCRAGRDYPQRRRGHRAPPARRGGRPRAVAPGRTSVRGSWWPVRRRISGACRAPISKPRSALSGRPSRAFPITRRRAACSHSVWCLRRTWDGSSVTAGLLPGREHAARAIALDDRDPWGHIALGYWALMERRTEELIAAFGQAVALNPNSAAAHSHLSRGFAFAGRDREAIEHGQLAIRLSPLDPEMALFLGAIAVAHFAAGRYAEAARHTADALRLRPGFQGAQRLRCASLALAGRIGEAQSYLATARRQQPQLSLAWIRANVPYQTQELLERFLDGMRKAGLD